MAGFDLKEGTFEDREVSEEELWSAIACIFSSKSKNDSSYKYGFLKSILDNLDQVDVDGRLNFDQIFTRFAELYWSLILVHQLRQKAATNDNRRSAIERVLFDARDKYLTSDEKPFDALPARARAEVSHQVKMKCKTYVVGALFEDTKRIFYSFSKRGEWIQINPSMLRFMSNCLLNPVKSYINTAEMVFAAEEATSRNLVKEMDAYREFGDSSDEDQIDEEVKALLDDPEALIKLLKKRRGI